MKTKSFEQIVTNNSLKKKEQETVIENVEITLYDRLQKLTNEEILILNYGALLYDLCS